MLMSSFSRILLFLKTQSNLVGRRMKICSFILLHRQLLLLFLLLPSLSLLKYTLEAKTPLVSSPTPATSTLDPISGDDLPIVLHRGKRQCVHPIFSFCSHNHLSSHSYSFIASLDSISLPNTVREALSHPG